MLFAKATWLVRYRANMRAWGRRALAAVGAADVWHAHDFTGLLAMAGRLLPHLPVVYESHELFLDSGSAARLPNAREAEAGIFYSAHPRL
jgi:hypothetical protein